MTVQDVTQQKQWGRIVAKAWTDEGFKSRLLSEPGAVFQEHGIDVPADIQVKVVQGTDKVLQDTGNIRHFTLPPAPTVDLVDEDLVRRGAADCHSGGCHRCHHCGHCGRCGCGCDSSSD